MRQSIPQALGVLFGSALLLAGQHVTAQTRTSIRDAVLADSGQTTSEVSTEELTRFLGDSSATVFDTRPRAEYAISHIPGARNVAPKPGVPMSEYVSDVAEIGRLLQGKRTAAVVLYCNGPHCGKTKRLAAELVAARYRNVRRYQLGIPVWRGLGGVCEIEAEGLRHVLGHDGMAVVIDTRSPGSFAAGSLPQTRNIPRDLVLPGKDTGEVRLAKNDGRLPMNDHNTRLVVVGGNAGDARYVAEALAREAFHNVSYFPGAFQEARTALQH